jgi:broad specificity phosphatase PhoE
VIALTRHGQSEANLAGRLEGVTDGPLTELGVGQGRGLAGWYDSADHIYSSELQRAVGTAHAYASVAGLGVTVRPDLHEMSFGSWEGLTPEDVRRRHPEEWVAVYEEGRDLARGGDGETFAGARERFAAALEKIAAAHRGGRVVVVTHGGVIRASAANVVGLGHEGRERLAMPANTSVSHLRLRPDGRVLVDFNLGRI